MASQTNRTALAIVAVIVAVVLFFAVNIFAHGAFRAATVDLTQGGIYTLSPGSHALLADLKEPITLRFYFSKRLGDSAPSYAAYAARVRELIERYAAMAGGKIRLEFYNPEPFSDTEDRAVAYGLQGVPFSEGGDQVYFGVAGTNSTDDEQVIPFFQPERERFLEYDLTKLIAALANPKKPVIGILSSLPIQGVFGNPMMGQQGGSKPPWAIMQQLSDQFTIRTVSDKADKIDPDVNALLIVHPKALSDQLQFAIDQFVLGGGRALVLVDPNAESDAASQGMMMMGATGSDLPKLLDAWGLKLVPDKVAGDRTLATRVTANIEGRQQTVDYVAWLTLDQNSLRRDDVVTGDLNNMLMATPGILEKKPDATTTFTPLISTTSQATEIAADQLRMVPDFLKLLVEYKPIGHPLVLAARVQGPAKTAFPNGPPGAKKPEPDKSEPPQPDQKKPDQSKPEQSKPDDKAGFLKESVKPINVIVVADVDFLQDRLWVRAGDFFGRKIVQPIAGNGDFVLDALDSLAGSDALIGLRSRGQIARPFTLVQKIKADADARYLAKEKELQDRLKDTEKKLESLQKENQPGAGGAGHQIMTADQQREIDKFRAEAVDTRQALRAVQHALREDIERLDTRLRFLNIGAVPLLIAVVAVIVALVRVARRRRRYGTA